MTWKIPLFALSLIFLFGFSGCAPLAVGGAVGGGLIASGQRTAGSILEDQAIETKAFLAVQSELSGDVNAGITSFNRNVLLTGQAPTEKMKARVEEIVRDLENIRKVYNEIQIGGASSFSTRASDALLTTRVKAVLIGIQDPGFSALQVKVVTEKGAVYLLGIISKENAALAVDAARNVSGVLRVVKVFEISGGN